MRWVLAIVGLGLCLAATNPVSAAAVGNCCFCENCCVVDLSGGLTCNDLCMGAGCGSSTGEQVGDCPNDPPCSVPFCCVCENECCQEVNTAPVNREEACTFACSLSCSDSPVVDIANQECSELVACGAAPAPAGAPTVSPLGIAVAAGLLIAIGFATLHRRARR